MAKLIVLCGLPGSGKSSYAQNILDNTYMYSTGDAEVVVHSSDAIRGELFGDPNFQGDNTKVFETMHKRVKEDLKAGKTVVYDATNVTRKARRGAINLAGAEDTVECHIIWAERDECIRRDSLRQRKVGREVIDKMLHRWQSPWKDEGFDKIELVLYQPDFDQLQYIAMAAADMHIPHENPHHTLNVWEHCKEAYTRVLLQLEQSPLKDAYYRPVLKTAVLWHDIGKPLTKTFHVDKVTDAIDYSHAHYYDHHCVGGYLSYGLFLRPDALGLSRQEIESACFTSWLISNHMEPFFNSHYYRDLDPSWKCYIDILHAADLAAH